MTSNNTKNFLQVLEDVVRRLPHNHCVCEDGETCHTYRQLWTDAAAFAAWLDRTSAPALVPLATGKGYAYIAALTGVWMSGRAFVPLDTRLPDERRDYILSEIANRDVVTADTFHAAIAADITPRSTASTPPADLHDKPAYVIFTSGTTGTPKGVVVTHSGLVNLAASQAAAFAVDSHSRYLLFLSLAFDASLSDILVTLASGACLVIETGDAMRLAASLMQVVDERGVTHLDIPPSLLRLNNPGSAPPSLRTIVIGGEAADAATVRAWAPRVNLVNVYGPTEATICTSLCRCTPSWHEPLIGHTLPGVEYSVEGRKPLPGDSGELWIAGECLASGYLNRPGLTAERFPVVGDRRYYRTADRVRILPGGEIAFAGRIDRQLKFNGQLIEPEEIERHIMRMAAVHKAAVTLLSTPGGQKQLAAFVLPRDGAMLTPADVRSALAASLPAWMIPGTVRIVSDIPVTVTGKIDFSRLDSPATTPRRGDMTPRERLVADIFCKALEIEDVGPDDHLCELGATSLQTLVLICSLESAGIKVDASDLRTASSPREIAALSHDTDGMAMPVDDLRHHWESSPDYRISTPVGDTCSSFLVTGATGFLGSHLLARLQQMFPEARFHCLVRCADETQGLRRILAAPGKVLPGHIHVVPGDISLPSLGLPDDIYRELAEDVDTVVHCAAIVNMLADFSRLRAANVDGTRHILDFACSGRYKHLHYASTLSVRVGTDRNSGVVTEDDALGEVREVYGGYAQSKFAADMMVQAVKPGQCRVSIYRYGLICGHSETGECAPRDFLSMFFRDARAVGHLPHDDSGILAVDITPVDFAVDITSRLIAATPPVSGIFNIAGEKPLLYNDLAQMMLHTGIVGKILPQNSFKEICSDPRALGIQIALCRLDPDTFKHFRYMDLMQSTSTSFSMSRVKAVLGAIPYIAPDISLIGKYLASENMKNNEKQ